MEETQKLRVVELFAGVGGFRVGFERCSPRFVTVWANQWEPGQAGQWAYKCYCQRFGEQANCSNEDIASVIHQVPEHDLLVGNVIQAAAPVAARPPKCFLPGANR